MIHFSQILPGTGRWQRVSADGGVDSAASGPSTAFGGPPPRSGEDL